MAQTPRARTGFHRAKRVHSLSFAEAILEVFVNEILLDASETIGSSSFAKEHMECFVTC
jgi:hypothetical protein